MRLRDLGELGFISALRENLAYRGGKSGNEAVRIIEGIGDDCAVVQFGGDPTILLTSDMMVEGTHFILDVIGPRRLGRKALSASLSDISAMGGIPCFALVSIGVPDSLPVEAANLIYEGLKERADEFALLIVGGDTVSSPLITIDVSVVGRAPGGKFIGRSGALPGDLVMVTGDLGNSGAGLALLRSGCELPGGRPAQDLDWTCELLVAHLDPTPRVREAGVLMKIGGVTSMIDVSDGLSTDVTHIARESRVGIRINADEVPISDSARLLASYMNVDPLQWALTGGEDYELLFTAPRPVVDRLSSEVYRETGTKVTVIGEVTDFGSGVSIEKGGEVIRIAPGGYDHFRSQAPEGHG